MVAWNEGHRLKKLLKHLRPHFETIIVGVQASQDATAAIAEIYADTVVLDAHRGFGDATYGPLVLPKVKTVWAFKVDADEWPSPDLLASLGEAIAHAEDNRFNGMWLPFRSSVDGLEYEEQHGHLRLFKTAIGWPETLHSRPMTDNTGYWPTGHIRHDRTLDEMMQDYLRYWEKGLGNGGWEDHNRAMMYHACLGTAQAKGWEYVQSFAWWPQVEAIAFRVEQPWLT
jgi:hypothetical protein